MGDSRDALVNLMVKVAESKEGVSSLCMSAEDWSAKEGKVDRVVVRGALHHFTRWASHFMKRQPFPSSFQEQPFVTFCKSLWELSAYSCRITP